MTPADRTPARRYFDNAATSFPKPPQVIDAVCDYLRYSGANAGRGAYREAVAAGELVSGVRGSIARLFNAGPGDHVVFAANCTDALNLALRGVLRPGDHVVTTWLEHNSVLRPLTALEEQHRVRWTALRPDPATTLLDVDDLSCAIQKDTRLVVVSHASNVSGAVQPLGAISQLCRERGVMLLLDAAQTAGHWPIDLQATPVDFLATAGHKGLLGPSGTGVLVIRAGAETDLRTTREGGTGSFSEEPSQPRRLPDRLEAGSLNVAGLAGLGAGVRWLLERGVERVGAEQRALSGYMLERLRGMDGVRLVGPQSVAQRVGVFSLRLGDWAPEELSAVLEQQFGILTRSGLHCAPFAHRLLGTLESGGLTRFSLGVFHTQEDIDAACDALARLAAG